MSSQPTHSAPKQTSDIDGDTITKDNVAETGTAKPGCFTGKQGYSNYHFSLIMNS